MSLLLWLLINFIDPIRDLYYHAHESDQSERVLLMGDSQAFGLNYVMPKLAKKDHVEFITVSISGSSVIMWAQPKTTGWDITDKWNQINQFKPTTILVSLGSNDSYYGPNIAMIDQPHMFVLLSLLKNTGAQNIIWIGPPKLARASAGLEAFSNLVISTGIEYYDSRLIDIDMEPDQLHTTGKGRKKWANWIWNKLTNEQNDKQWGN